MIELGVTANLNNTPWDDLETPGEARLVRVGLLPDGTHGGKPAVVLAIELADGTHVVAGTSWLLFHAAHEALTGARQRLAGNP